MAQDDALYPGTPWGRRFPNSLPATELLCSHFPLLHPVIPSSSLVPGQEITAHGCLYDHKHSQMVSTSSHLSVLTQTPSLTGLSLTSAPQP